MQQQVLLFIFLAPTILFGRVAYLAKECMAYAQHTLTPLRAVQSFFTKSETGIDLKQLLLGMIHRERTGIYAALFQLSDKDIAEALVEAHQRGVEVEVVLESSGLGESYSKVDLLFNAGIPVYVYKESGLMHHKFYVFRNSLENRPLIWTGSINSTAGGFTRNVENANILADRDCITRYYREFLRLRNKIGDPIGKLKGRRK